MRSATRQKLGKDKAYLDYIHDLPCCVCVKLNVPQTSRTEAAHCGPRGLSQKCPDREALPLCHEHHGRDGGQFTQHQMGKMFWRHFDLDRDELIAKYQAKYDSEQLGVLNPLEVVEAL